MTKLSLDTKVNINNLIGKKSEEHIKTMRELGFEQYDLDKYSLDQIEGLGYCLD